MDHVCPGSVATPGDQSAEHAELVVGEAGGDLEDPQVVHLQRPRRHELPQQIILAPLECRIGRPEAEHSVDGGGVGQVGGHLLAEHGQVLRGGEKDVRPVAAERGGQLGEELRRNTIDAGDVVEVEDHATPAAGAADDVADDRFDRGKGEIPLSLEEVDLAAVFAEACPLHGMSDAARVPLRPRAPHSSARVGTKRRVELVQLPGLREFPAHLESPGTVSLGVEPRGVDADAQLPGEHGHHATRHTALGRHADVVDPATREVVHPA